MITLKNIAPILLFILLISFSQACCTGNFGQHADSLFLVTEHVEVNYDLKSPDEKHFLPYVLEEVSGLTFKSPNSVLAVDDESGRVYEYNLNKKDITHSIQFYKSDDYEGVELLKKHVYVLKSDGDIFRFPYTSKKELIADKFENAFTSKNDTEGLGFDLKNNQLIIACKEEGSLSDNQTNGRAFYAINLDSMTLIERPLFTIGPDQLKRFWEQNRSFEYNKDRIKFKPSAIATHPISGHYYILSSVGKMLVVVNKNGLIQATYPISPRILGQPEGLCFSPEGTMYISSEGEGDRGYILTFKMNKPD
ncbi:SdiA-regulated [Ekhidna lutea]|uniref:SdiA-regulated n=1 Tax=Ekhidna lutea TaxID=447679 RepID=A0A239IE83_EKHLU|nr:SdiA-regulated domain-containing protein [Ekhidna lutea]SNS91865.1 SdiA-regulated [Ekhidna lutea]